MAADSRQLGEVASRKQTVRDFLVAAPVIAMVTLLSWQFIDLTRAEMLLQRAAEAAAQEALLPRASSDTIAAAAQRVLRQTRLADVVDRPIVAINGQSVLHNPLDLLESGDQVQVTVGAYATDVVPDVLRWLQLTLAGRKLHATASCIKP